MDFKNIKITDYSNEFIKRAISLYIHRKERDRKRSQKYYSTKEGKEKNQLRAKIYYYKVKKNNAYHEKYNPQGIKKTSVLTN